jgi:hypothetical protein
MMIKAEEARKQSSENERLTIHGVLKRIEVKIKQAITAGNYAINIEYLGDNPKLIQVLRDLGYTVKCESDQREGKSWTTISW